MPSSANSIIAEYLDYILANLEREAGFIGHSCLGFPEFRFQDSSFGQVLSWRFV
jgi:hypothetical protein